jgi:hypothetical protein
MGGRRASERRGRPAPPLRAGRPYSEPVTLNAVLTKT